jgi:hypothetical protein
MNKIPSRAELEAIRNNLLNCPIEEIMDPEYIAPMASGAFSLTLTNHQSRLMRRPVDHLDHGIAVKLTSGTHRKEDPVGTTLENIQHAIETAIKWHTDKGTSPDAQIQSIIEMHVDELVEYTKKQRLANESVSVNGSMINREILGKPYYVPTHDI